MLGHHATSEHASSAFANEPAQGGPNVPRWLPEAIGLAPLSGLHAWWLVWLAGR